MPKTISGCVLALSLSLVTSLAVAQVQGDAPRVSKDPRVLLRYATFDPLAGVPQTPLPLSAGLDTNLWIVQFAGSPTDEDRAPLLAAGAKIRGFLPHDSHVVLMDAATRARVVAMPNVRWVGAYEPAYRLEGFLIDELLAGGPVPTRKYQMVMADKRNDKAALEAKVRAIGGVVVDRQLQSLLFTVELTGAQLLAAARFDEVLWIDRWTEVGEDMDNARIVQGSNAIETVAGYTGTGVRGHVYEGVEATHPDFTTPMTNVLSSGAAQTHGHCTAGCIFGNGASAPQARGHAPGAVGFYTNYTTVTAGYSRNAVINDVVNVHQCMFTTASWGSVQTTAYTSVSADADDIVFDHRIPWTNSMSNLGTQSVRPEAWAKNVISVGGLSHGNDANPANDTWTTASVGPAADGRNKPDLCNFYDNVWTSDLSGTAGYNTAAGTAGNSYTGFSGTSSATPITAGLNALAIQIYTDHVLNNAPRVVGGTRFQDRADAQTLKALQIACASLYPVAQATRPRAGWGYANVETIYTRRAKMTIVPEDTPITQGATQTYNVQVAPGETSLKVCMTYLEPAGNPAAALTRINDLTLRVIAPDNTSYWGNNGLATANVSSSGGAADTIDTVENVFIDNPATGVWRIEITAPSLTTDAHLATAATDATYALVVNGGIRLTGSGCSRLVPSVQTSPTEQFYPWGGFAATTLPTTYLNNNGGAVGGTVYFNVTITNPLYLTSLSLNTSAAAGQQLLLDVYRTAVGGTYVGNEANLAAWTPVSAGTGTAAGAGLPSAIDLKTPIRLMPGTYGIAVNAANFAHLYTNGTGTNQNYSDTNLSIALGSASNGKFVGAPFSPRVANITLGYRSITAAGTNVRYQVLVPAATLASAGTITGLSFKATQTGRHYNDLLVVYMSHVPAGHVLSSTFSANLPTAWSMLYLDEHSFQYVAGDWTEIGLSYPFAYNGTSDLVIEIQAYGNWQTTNSGSERSIPGLQRLLATNWITLPTTGTLDTGGANIRLSFNCADTNEYGTSCGRLEAAHTGTGARGSTTQLQVANATPNSVAFASIGFDNNVPYPVNLNIVGFTNCFAYSDNSVMVTVGTDALGGGSYPIAVPNNPALDGARIFATWVGLDASEPGSITLSGYTRMIVGVAP